MQLTHAQTRGTLIGPFQMYTNLRNKCTYRQTYIHRIAVRSFFFQNEMVSHLPTYREFCQRGQLTIDNWWLLHLLSQITKKRFFFFFFQKSILCAPCSDIFLKNTYRRPRFLTISTFGTKLDLFPWTRTFSKKTI